MKIRRKAIIIWSIVFWTCIIAGAILFGFSLGNVPIGSYGLRSNYFQPLIEAKYYTPGLYYKQIGYYFILFPRFKQVLSDLSVKTTNKDLQQIQIKYSMAYRINPDKLYDMYNTMGLKYQERLISVINSIISNNYMKTTQVETRVYLQSSIVDEIKNSQKMSIFGGSLLIQGLWINDINFDALQSYYDQAYVGTSSYSSDYVNTEIQLQKTIINIQSIKDVINSTYSRFILQMNQHYLTKREESRIGSVILNLQQKINISESYSVSRVFEYYNPSKIIITQ